MVSEFPHWLSQDRMLSGSAHVLIGIQTDNGSRPAVLIVNGSGSLDYSKSVRLRLILLNRRGSEMVATETLAPFTHKLIWLDEAYPDFEAHMDGGYGTLIVRSRDADLNANLVNLWNGSSVSLQHMWGY